MKKITVIVVLVWAVCLNLAFPASAATFVDNGYFLDVVSQLKEWAQGDSDGYNYVFFYSSNFSTVTPTSGTYLLSKSPVISSGDTVKMGTFYVTSANHSWSASPTAITIISITNYVNNSYIYMVYKSGTTQKTVAIRTIFEESTATLLNQENMVSEQLSNGYDMILKCVPYVDITALESLLLTAKSTANIGYTSVSWQALQAAITAAESLLNTTGYTQQQVDVQKDNLQSALNGLTLLPDTTALQSLISTAKAIQDTGYTSVSWQLQYKSPSKERFVLIFIIAALVLSVFGYAMTVDNFSDYEPPSTLYID